MITPVTRVGNPSSVARRPRRVLCRPAPSMSTPMPRSNGQFAVIALNGTLRPIGDHTRILRHADRGPRADFSMFHGGILHRMRDSCWTSRGIDAAGPIGYSGTSHVGGTARAILMKSPLHSDRRRNLDAMRAR